MHHLCHFQKYSICDCSQLAIDIFPLIPIAFLEQILDENWFPEYNHNHHGKVTANAMNSKDKSF